MYFGIRKGKEHCLHFETARMEPDAASIEGFPFSIFQLDTGFLESWKVTDLPDGRVYWTKGGDPLWFAFCWWDRSGSRLTQSNSGFYVRGFAAHDQLAAFRYACEKFPDVVSRQNKNLTLLQSEARCFLPQTQKT